MIETVYQYLPLGTLVNNEVLIVHGGISDITDLERIKSIDRRKVRDYYKQRYIICDRSALFTKLLSATSIN